MKKRLLVTLFALMALVTLLVGCKKVECDICGETKSCKTEELFGQEIHYCKDCQEDLEKLFGE